MMEPRCAVCGETETVNLYMFNYGMCLCHRCMETAAQTFVHDSAERKLKETEKKKESVDVEGMSKQEYESMKELKDEIAKKMWDEITEKIKKKREADAKKMAKSSEEIGKSIFVERDDQPESINDLKKALDKVIKAQDSLTTNFINVQLDANRYRRKYDELCEEFRTKLKVCNTWMLVASAASLLVGVALGYGLR